MKPILMTPERAEKVYREIAERGGYDAVQIMRFRTSPLDPAIRTAHVKGRPDLVEQLTREVLQGVDR